MQDPSGHTEGQPAEGKTPEYRSRVVRGGYKQVSVDSPIVGYCISLTLVQPDALYANGQKVWIKKARAMDGPYKVEKRNSDGTYELKDDLGNIKHNVKEKDIDDNL